MVTMRLLLTTLCLLLLNACVVVPPQVHSIIVNDRVVTEPGANVQLLRGGAAIPLAPGTPLEPGDEIVTGPDTQAVLMLENGRVEVTIFENSEVLYSSLFLKLGEVYVRVKSKVEGWFVDADYIEAMPEDTGYIVGVGSNGEYICQVLEGQVRIRSKTAAWRPVTINARQQITATGRSTPNQTPLDRRQYNRLVDRINKIERLYRPAAELIAPDLVELTEAEAQRELRARGFSPATIVGVVTGKARIGTVVSQSPSAGTHIRPRSALRLNVEVKPTPVPNVVGSTLQVAGDRLASAQLELGSVRDQLEVGVESGIVRSQSVPPNKQVAPGTRIDLVVSEKGASVPSLRGLTVRRAMTILSNADLKLGDQTKRASTETVNTIIDQDPRPNEIVRANSEVNVVLAMQEVRHCTVPSVAGLTPAQAANRLQSAGFSNIRYSGQGGYLWGERPTDPSAGSRVPCNSTVTINTVIG